jgi:hypothetical protein
METCLRRASSIFMNTSPGVLVGYHAIVRSWSDNTIVREYAEAGVAAAWSGERMEEVLDGHVSLG